MRSPISVWKPTYLLSPRLYERPDDSRTPNVKLRVRFMLNSVVPTSSGFSQALPSMAVAMMTSLLSGKASWFVLLKGLMKSFWMP